MGGAMDVCGEIEGTELNDGLVVTCLLAPNHGGYLHAWSHRLHGGQQQGHAVWPTEQGRSALASGLITWDWLHGDHADVTRLELNSR